MVRLERVFCGVQTIFLGSNNNNAGYMGQLSDEKEKEKKNINKQGEVGRNKAHK